MLNAEAFGGELRLTTPDVLGSVRREDLVILTSGFDLASTPVFHTGKITATGSVLLCVGDDVSTPDIALISAGANIDIFGDFGNADAGFGTTMDIHGTITPGTGATNRTAIFGDSDVDTFNFLQIQLNGQTNTYGSNTTAVPTNAVNDGEDRFFVDRLKTMNTFRASKGPW